MSKAMLLVTLVVLLALAAPAFAADITLTVTLGVMAIEISPPTWAMGVVPPTVAKSSWVSGDPGYFTVTNTGNAEADIMIQSGNTSPSGWVPDQVVGKNVYTLSQGIGISPYTNEPTWNQAWAPGSILVQDLPAGGTQEFDLRFTAPTADSDYVQGDDEQFTVTLSATTLGGIPTL